MRSTECRSSCTLTTECSVDNGSTSDSDCQALAVTHDAHATTTERRQQSRTAQHDGRPVGLLGRAHRARPEVGGVVVADVRLLVFAVVISGQIRLRVRDVERIALAVAESVQYSRSKATVLHKPTGTQAHTHTRTPS